MALNPLIVTDAFQRSLENADQYPQNLVERFTYSATLKAYRSRLDKASSKLFVGSETKTEVAFRDFDANAQKFERTKIRSLQQLLSHLWIEEKPTTGGAVQKILRRRDPKCRFIFVYGDHSRAPLKITERMSAELLTYHQVMPSYLDFMLLFGQNSGPNDMRFSGFREQTCLTAPPANTPGLDALGRSGLYFEIAYNLKTVQLKYPDDSASWSVRQAGIHHKFDVCYGTSLWIITKGLNHYDESHDLKSRIEEITGRTGREEDRKFDTPEDCFRASLAIHAMIVHWATESWRWYLQWLDESIESQTEHAVHGTRDKNDLSRKWYTGEDLQRIQKLEDAVNEVTIVVEGNIEVMAAMHAYYEGLVENKDWPLPASWSKHSQAFSKQTKNAVYDLKMQSARARALARHTGERKNLILQYVQAQTAENMEDLTKCTYNVGISAQKETIVMRIITVVTLIYLPATFVSTFFSTDVVKYQNQKSENGTNLGNLTTSSANGSSSTSFSTIAMNRWLQVSLPLTAVTLVAAYLAYLWAKTRQYKKNMQVLDEFKLV